MTRKQSSMQSYMGSGRHPRIPILNASTHMSERNLHIMEQITFTDFFSQETKRDPIAFSTHLREQGPFVHLPGVFGMAEGWVVTDYDDAITVLKDPRFIKDTQKISLAKNDQESGGERADVLRRFLTFRRDMLTVDPPDHTRLRGLVSKAFTPRVIEQLRPRIQQIADELLDAVQDQGKMDLIADFAFPLPITVICELLGIPVEDRQQFRSWSQTIVNRPTGVPDEEAFVALEQFVQYIKSLLADKHVHPGNDLVSSLVHAEEQGDRLSEAELISTIFLLIVAGHETTVNLIGRSEER